MNSISMYKIILTRIFAFTAMFLMASRLQDQFYYFLFNTVVFAHYLLQIIFTKNGHTYLGFKEIVSASRNQFLLRFLFIVIVCYLFFSSPYFPLAVSFCIHFVFTETYLKELKVTDSLSRFFFQATSTSIYAIYMAKIYPFNLLPADTYIWCFFIALFCAAGDGIYRSKKILNSTSLFILYEMIGLIFVTNIHTNTHPLIDIIFYHLFWWMIYPLLNIHSTGVAVIRKSVVYFMVSLIVTGACFYLFSIYNYKFYVFTYEHRRIFGSMHIISSFFLSRQNPEWINKLFLKTQMEKVS